MNPYLFKKAPGKYFLPVCEECLEPFEEYDWLFADNPQEGDRWKDVKLRHRRCLPVKTWRQVAVNEHHKEVTMGTIK
jgi:hypothetical protein